MRSTESVIIGSYPTSVSGTIVLLNINHLIKKYLEFYFLPTRVFGHFEGTFSVIKLSVSKFGQTTGYRELIRLLEIQYLEFGKYPPLVTDTQGNNCFSICQMSE